MTGSASCSDASTRARHLATSRRAKSRPGPGTPRKSRPAAFQSSVCRATSVSVKLAPSTPLAAPRARALARYPLHDQERRAEHCRIVLEEVRARGGHRGVVEAAQHAVL